MCCSSSIGDTCVYRCTWSPTSTPAKTIRALTIQTDGFRQNGARDRASVSPSMRAPSWHACRAKLGASDCDGAHSLTEPMSTEDAAYAERLARLETVWWKR